MGRSQKEPGGPGPAKVGSSDVTLVQASALDQVLSQVGASAAVLSDLASTPIGAGPRPSHIAGKSRVDILLAAPTKEWADTVSTKLKSALGEGVDLVSIGPAPPEGVYHGFALRYSAAVPGTGTEAEQRVARALESIPEVDVEYSAPIDLFVAKARA
jgi:hypothetical protein